MQDVFVKYSGAHILMTRIHPRTIAYLRVSTNDQDLEKNQADILRLANRKNLGHVHFVEETASGRVPWRRRKIATILEQLQPGDTLVVSELSRLGRSMLECMEMLSIATQKGIHLHAVKGEWQLDGSMQSTIIAMAFAMAAEIGVPVAGVQKTTICAFTVKGEEENEGLRPPIPWIKIPDSFRIWRGI
jgi:predicted site-specific integrase-resolvase